MNIFSTVEEVEKIISSFYPDVTLTILILWQFLSSQNEKYMPENILLT